MPNPATVRERRLRKTKAQLIDEIDTLEQRAAAIEATYVSTQTDITDLKRAEEALRESEEQVRLLLNSTAEAIYGIDLEGNCSFANPACAEMLGYDSAEDLLGKHIHDLIHHTRSDGTQYPAEECLIYQAYRRGEGREPCRPCGSAWPSGPGGGHPARG